jgi:3-deoxy-D-manno-octulosonic-acid transferase
MIEPAALGVPVCFGPHIWNFADTVDRLLERAGAVKLDDPSQLTPCFERWLDQPDEARAMGERAKAFIQSQQGAVERTIELLDRALGSPSSGSSIERIDALDRRDVNPNSVAA